MNEAKTQVEQAEDSVRAKAAQLLIRRGLLNPESATNDEAVLAAYNEGLAQISEAAAEKAAEEGLTKEQAAATGVYDAIADKIDEGQFAEEVLRRAQEIREARDTKRNDIPAPRSQADIGEAGKAAADILDRVNKSGGLMNYVTTGSRTRLRDLMKHTTGDDKIRTLQRANDNMLLLASHMGLGATTHQEGGEPSELGIRKASELGCYEKFMDGFSAYAKAMGTTEGSAWTPTVYSADMIENVYQTTAVARVFPRAPWVGTGGTMSVPAEGTDIAIYGSTEATSDDDDPKYTANTPGVGTTVTATAKTITARTVWSYEMEEDAIIPILEHVRGKFNRAFAEGLDEAIMDGDTSATHQDTGYAVVAGDRRKQFIGLRYKALNQSDTLTSLSSYFNWEAVMTPALRMGKYAQGMEGDPANGPAGGGQRLTDTVLFCSHAMRTKMGALRDTKDNNIWLTPRYAGDADVRGRGYSVVDMIGGFQIIPTRVITANYTTAGIYDGSTTTHDMALFCYCPAFHIYDKALFTSQVIDRPEQGQRVMVARMRLSFTLMYASTDNVVGGLYNYVTTSF